MGLCLEPAHMEILEKAFFDNLQRDNCEYGAIGVDCKRPFGNSDVEADILEMLKQPMEGDDGDSKCWSSGQRDYAAALYRHLIPWLQRKMLIGLTPKTTSGSILAVKEGDVNGPSGLPEVGHGLPETLLDR